MAAALRLSASTPKALLIEAVTPRRLSSVANGFRGAVSQDAERTPNKAQWLHPDDAFGLRTPKSNGCTPKTPSAAEQFLNIAMASSSDEQATAVNLGTKMIEAVAYPRLLGMPLPETAQSDATGVSKRSVTFENESLRAATDARNAFLAMRQRNAGRTIPKASEKVVSTLSDAGHQCTSASIGATVAQSAGYPHLLGMPTPTTSKSEAVDRPKRCVTFEDDARNLAVDARNAFLAATRLRTSRSFVKSEENGSKGDRAMAVFETADTYPMLLGCGPLVLPTASTEPKRSNLVDADTLAQDARATFLAMQQRIAMRSLPKHSD